MTIILAHSMVRWRRKKVSRCHRSQRSATCKWTHQTNAGPHCPFNVPNRHRAATAAKPAASASWRPSQVLAVRHPARPVASTTIIQPPPTTTIRWWCRASVSVCNNSRYRKAHRNCVPFAVTPPRVNTMAYARAKAVKVSSNAPCKRARNTCVWPINRVRWTNAEGIDANSVAFRSV